MLQGAVEEGGVTHLGDAPLRPAAATHWLLGCLLLGLAPAQPLASPHGQPTSAAMSVPRLLRRPQESPYVRPLIYKFCKQPKNIQVFPKVLLCALRSGEQCTRLASSAAAGGLRAVRVPSTPVPALAGGAISNSLAKAYSLSGNALATSKVGGRSTLLGMQCESCREPAGSGLAHVQRICHPHSQPRACVTGQCHYMWYPDV